MIEAEITCECAAIALPDLGLSLTKGMVVYIAADRARQSADLQRAWRALGVTLKYVQRFRERRAEPPVSLAQAIQSKPRASYYPEGGPEPIPELRVDVEALADLVVERLAPRFQAMLELALAGLAPLQQFRAQQVIAPSSAGTVVDDVPVFVPSRIGREDLRATVTVASTEGEGGGVTDALAALNAARKSEKPG